MTKLFGAKNLDFDRDKPSESSIDSDRRSMQICLRDYILNSGTIATARYIFLLNIYTVKMSLNIEACTGGVFDIINYVNFLATN